MRTESNRKMYVIDGVYKRINFVAVVMNIKKLINDNTVICDGF